MTAYGIEKTVVTELTRRDICDLMLACTAADIAAGNPDQSKWTELYKELENLLNKIDEPAT